MGELETLQQKKDINNILKRIPELIDFQKTYEKVKYLCGIKEPQKQEQFLYEVYEPILKIAGTSFRPFTDFSQTNNDTFSRLKWKWLATNFP